MANDNEVDPIWAADQLRRAGYSDRTSSFILRLVDTWNEQLEKVSNDDLGIAREAVNELFQHHSLLPQESEEVWIEAHPGFIHAQDIVRVRHDAFEGELGEYHNGRVGKCLAVRSGQIIFRSTDGVTPFIDGARYTADHLEKKIK